MNLCSYMRSLTICWRQALRSITAQRSNRIDSCCFLGGRRKTPYFSTFLKAPFRYLLVEDKQGRSAVSYCYELVNRRDAENAEVAQRNQ